MFKRAAFNLGLVASFILIFAGVPEVNVNTSPADLGTKIEVRMIGSVAHADGEYHACGDDPITWNIFKHSFAHCKWWGWLGLAAVLIAAFAGIAALIAGSNGSFLTLAAKVWKWIQAGHVGAAAVLAVVTAFCWPGAVCDEDDEDDEGTQANALEALLSS